MQGFEKRALAQTASTHWLVHVLEMSFGALLVNIAGEFGMGLLAMGVLANILGFAFGFSSLPAGFLADRISERLLLMVCCIGMAVSAVAIGFAPNVYALGSALLVLGLSLGLYHPASLSYISRIMTRRGLGFGYLGVGGNLGTALGPIIVGAIAGGFGWRVPYFVLAVPALLLAVLYLTAGRATQAAAPEAAPAVRREATAFSGRVVVAVIVLVLVAGMLNGFVYRGALTFLPLYLGQRVDLAGVGLSGVLAGNSLTTLVLLFGVGGQFLGGWLSERRPPEVLAVVVAVGSAPMLALMGWFSGPGLVLASIVFAFFYFMGQPVYNMLVVRYGPERWRGRLYGLSFFFGFGLGSFAASFSGFVAESLGTNWVYLTCAGFTALTLVIAVTIVVISRQR